tara:strand:+ start:307 stop:573 length:267 start_codon:yes stop_codon:yes gene_type:complete
MPLLPLIPLATTTARVIGKNKKMREALTNSVKTQLKKYNQSIAKDVAKSARRVKTKTSNEGAAFTAGVGSGVALTNDYNKNKKKKKNK